METRKRKLMINKAGGTAGKDSVNYRVSLPAPWVKAMGLDRDDRDLELRFDGEKITIEREGGIRMLKLVELREGGEKTELVEGTLEVVVNYLKENEEIYNWVQDEDPEIELPELENIETVRELEAELEKVNLGWWSLEIFD